MNDQLNSIRISRDAGFMIASILMFLLAGLVEGADVTERLVDLGNKPAEWGLRGHSLNPWDLQAFRGKVFIGMGSTVADSGPQAVWAFDHSADSWGREPETVIEQEAIELYRIIGDSLYIPASDPTGNNTDASKFHRRDADGNWTHFLSTQSFPTAHIRDLAGHDQLLIGVGNSRNPHVLLGADPGSVSVPMMAVDVTRGGDRELPLFRSAISLLPPGEDGGRVDVETSQRNRMANWFFAVFQLHDGLYASTRWLSWAPNYPEPVGVHWLRPLYPPQIPPFPAVVRWNSTLGEWVAPRPGALDRLIPESSERNTQLTLRPFKPVLFGEIWFAPIRSYGLGPTSYRRFYNQSVDFVVKTANGPGLRLVLPRADALGEAVLINGDHLYVLANALQSEDEYLVVVYELSLDDAQERKVNSATGLALDAWREVLSFRSSNLARSFARIDDTWYFGLGFANGQAPRRAGTLLRLDPAANAD